MAVVKVAAVYVLARVPFKRLPGSVHARIIPVQNQMHMLVLLHQWAAFFKESKGIEDKTICQWSLLIAVDGAKRQEAKEAFKDGDLFCAVVNKSNVLRGTASFKVFVAQLISPSFVLKTDNGMLPSVQKKIYLPAKPIGNFQRDTSFVQII